MKQTLGVFLIKLGIAAVFVATAAVTLFFAYGYRFDVEENVVQKTSIIDVVHDPLEAQVFLDGRLIAGRMPIQIKGVLPGVHTLRVERDAFVSWQRDMRVAEDVVTIVRDVFLVPESLQEFTEEVFAVESSDGVKERIFYGPEYLLVTGQEAGDLRLVELFDDGAVQEEEVPLPEKVIATVETFPGQRFLVRFEDGLMTFVSFRDRQFKTFRPFDGVDKMLVDSDRRLLYFLSEGVLYSLRYDQVSEALPALPFVPPQEQYADAVFLTSVDDFFVDGNGRVFSVSGGRLWVDGVPLLEQQLALNVPTLADVNRAVTVFEEERWTNVSVLNGPAGDDLLVLRNADNERYLFLVPDGYGSIENFRLVTDRLRGKPFFFGNGDVLYADEEGAIFSVTALGVKRFAFQSDGPFELLGPYGTEGHFLMVRGGALQVRDVFNAYKVTLAEDFSAEKLFSFPEALFYFTNGTLTRIMWE